MAVSNCEKNLINKSCLIFRSFAEDQYFDSHGMFITTVLSLPVILNCCVLIVSDRIK
jgi:hypothetical protein